jgi:5-methylcytosine-specific restriction endonuclease McrA
MNPAPKPAPAEVNEDARAFIRSLRCIRCFELTGASVFKCEAAHVKTKRNNGDVANLIPLCRHCHQLQHQWGIKSFEKNVGKNLRKVAKDLWDWYVAKEEPF